MNIKRIIREELDSGLQWIKDVKSNKDIAEELFSQTVITKYEGIVKLPFSWAHNQPKKPYFDLSIKKKYGKDIDSDDIWERYKLLVNNRLNELRPKKLKESDDFDWVKDVDPGIKLEPNTIYWFQPKIKSEEGYRFANRITNSEDIKTWLLEIYGIPQEEHSIDDLGGIQYFVTGDVLNNTVSYSNDWPLVSWCTSTSYNHITNMYPENKVVLVNSTT
tara:strand:- start:1457 stop:2110 length:654 start_codon:yes stop_codon:yes gene_type:complete